VGDALIVFVARDSKTNKAFKVPEMRVSKYDNLSTTMKCFELGLTIKDWSKDKSMRDMHDKIPDFSESRSYQDILSKMRQKSLTNPDSIVKMA
jgi:hypothetical protein